MIYAPLSFCYSRKVKDISVSCRSYGPAKQITRGHTWRLSCPHGTEDHLGNILFPKGWSMGEMEFLWQLNDQCVGAWCVH